MRPRAAGRAGAKPRETSWLIHPRRRWWRSCAASMLKAPSSRQIVAKAASRISTIIYRCVAGLYPDGSGIKPAPIPHGGGACACGIATGSRAALVTRMWRTAERQVEEIEERLTVAGIELVERESNARTLAIVAKTLRELSAVDRRKRRKRRRSREKTSMTTPSPRNIDEFRRELARRIERSLTAGTGVRRSWRLLNHGWAKRSISDWGLFAHGHQKPPEGDWTTWLLLGGRGAGKTRAGAEWIKALVDGGRPQCRPDRADRRDRTRCPRGDGRGRLRAACGA